MVLVREAATSVIGAKGSSRREKRGRPRGGLRRKTSARISVKGWSAIGKKGGTWKECLQTKPSRERPVKKKKREKGTSGEGEKPLN